MCLFYSDTDVIQVWYTIPIHTPKDVLFMVRLIIFPAYWWIVYSFPISNYMPFHPVHFIIIIIIIIGELAPLLSALGHEKHKRHKSAGVFWPDLDACGCVCVSPDVDAQWLKHSFWITHACLTWPQYPCQCIELNYINIYILVWILFCFILSVFD